MFFLQEGILLGASLLGFVALIIMVFAFGRYQRASAAARQATL